MLEFINKNFRCHMAKKCLIRQKCDFSMFSGFLRRQMKSDMLAMPNQGYSENTQTTLLGIPTKLYFIIRPRNAEKIENSIFCLITPFVTMRFRSVVKSSIFALFCSKRLRIQSNTPLIKYINLVWHANHVRLHLTA